MSRKVNIANFKVQMINPIRISQKANIARKSTNSQSDQQNIMSWKENTVIKSINDQPNH